MRVALVLRSGGEYKPEHVARLAAQIADNLPGANIVCLSDCDVPSACGVDRIRLRHDWPGWWAKMEIFAPWIDGDILYFDLDTVIRGSLADIAAVNRLTLLRDFYRPRGLGSGMMFLPKRCRNEIWRAWIRAPERHMREHKQGGDQAFLERFWLGRADRWQDVLPGSVVSYKAHVRKATSARECGNGTVPDGARVICYHGRPRPWDALL